jgi:ectoine hydroxylase-related dioxygenase (phytanoyl-CoA dioxygenase family)
LYRGYQEVGFVLALTVLIVGARTKLREEFVMVEAIEKTTRSNYLPFVETERAATTTELQRRMHEYSYLFFRKLIAADAILEIRQAVLELCREASWLDPKSELLQAIAASDMRPLSEGKAEYAAVYRKVLRLPLFHNLPTHPNLVEIASKLLNANSSQVLIHPRRIGRITFPNHTIATTPPHQDYYYIRGSVNTFSCWIPLGECPISLGGLAVVPGSHRGGYLEHNLRYDGAVGGTGISLDESKTTWHTADFGIGDVLFFHSYTIHKALPNLSGNRLRLSTDNRYQLQGDTIDPDALLPHKM